MQLEQHLAEVVLPSLCTCLFIEHSTSLVLDQDFQQSRSFTNKMTAGNIGLLSGLVFSAVLCEHFCCLRKKGRSLAVELSPGNMLLMQNEQWELAL